MELIYDQNHQNNMLEQVLMNLGYLYNYWCGDLDQKAILNLIYNMDINFHELYEIILWS